MKFSSEIFKEMNVVTDIENWLLENDGQINEKHDEILRTLSQNEVNASDYDTKDDYNDAIFDEYSSIIRICSFNTESLLYHGLLEWYGNEENMLKHIRSVYLDNTGVVSNYYFVTGIGYDTISQDLLGCGCDGRAKKEFIEMLNGKNTNFNKFMQQDVE